MKIYCPHCGGPSQYAGEKPKFCSSCGNSLSILAEKQKNYVVHEDIDIDVEEELEKLNIGNMEGLDFEIEHPQCNTITFGSLMNSMEKVPQANGEISFSNIARPKRTKKQVMNDFKKEAGTLRQSKDA